MSIGMVKMCNVGVKEVYIYIFHCRYNLLCGLELFVFIKLLINLAQNGIITSPSSIIISIVR